MTATPHPEMEVVDHGTESGIDWITSKAPLYGAVNGYVKLPEGHVWSGYGYDDIDVEVHGGLTYATNDWIGFDTLHAGDVWPDMEADFMPHRFHEGWDRRWTPDMVAEEARNLARKVSEAGPETVRCSACGQALPPKP